MLSIKKRRKILRRGSDKAHELSWISFVLEGIQRERGSPGDCYSPLMIKAFIHKVVLSGLWGNVQEDYNKLWRVFENPYVDETFKPKERMPGYKTRWIKQSPEFQIYIYTYPKGIKSPFLIEIIPREKAEITDWKNMLLFINLWFPGIKVSSVDYAIDEYCYDSESAERLYWVQLKNLFIPHKQNVNFLGGTAVSYGDRTRMNSVCRIDDVKTYERGPDNLKKGEGWMMADVNRVRLEYSAPRSVLKKKGISELADLIRTPRFHEINKDIYHFRCFSRSKKLPGLGQAYEIPGSNGKLGCFQELHIAYRENKFTNLSHYSVNIEEFDKLKSSMTREMQRYDAEWVGNRV